MSTREIEFQSAMGTPTAAYIAETNSAEDAADMFQLGRMARSREIEETHVIKPDYWTCKTCGTDYGTDQNECADSLCQSRVIQVEQEFWEDYAADDNRG